MSPQGIGTIVVTLSRREMARMGYKAGREQFGLGRLRSATAAIYCFARGPFVGEVEVVPVAPGHDFKIPPPESTS